MVNNLKMDIKVLRILCVIFFVWPVSRAEVNRGRSDRQVPSIDFSKGVDDEQIDGALVVNTNRSISLNCDGGMHPVEWVVDHGDQIIGPSFGGSALDKLRNVGTSSTARLIGTSLGHSYTGRYICRYSDAKHLNSSIYIYVSDPAHPFVEKKSLFPVIQPVYQNKPLVLPCKTTRPNISVDFKKNTIPVPKEKYKFYPEHGIVVNNTEHYFTGLFTCGVQSHTLDFILQYISDPGTIVITSLLPSSYKMLVGESFNITCKTSVSSSTGLSMSWKYPDTQRTEGLLIKPPSRVSDSMNRNEIISEFHLNDTKLTDSGTYRCILELSSGQSSFKEVNITIIDKTFVFLTPEKALYEVEEGMDVVMTVTFDSYPVPQFEWYKDGKLINRNPSILENLVGFAASKSTRNMAGMYTLRAYTRDQNASTDIMLLVRYKCPDGYVLLNNSKGYDCEACPEGYYIGINDTTCQPCPENSMTFGTASTSIDDCQCERGFYDKRTDNYATDKDSNSESKNKTTFICEEFRENAEPSRSNKASNVIHNIHLLLSIACLWLLSFVRFTDHSSDEFMVWSTGIVFHPSVHPLA